MAFTLTSTAFAEGEDIPRRLTCQGEEASPPLMWSHPPAGTRSFALIVHDPDTPKGDLTHWVLCDIPVNVNALPEGVAPNTLGATGNNSLDKEGYSGPCPPEGDPPHRYLFELNALDVTLNLAPGCGRAQVEAAMQDHLIGQAVLQGTYQSQ